MQTDLILSQGASLYVQDECVQAFNQITGSDHSSLSSSFSILFIYVSSFSISPMWGLGIQKLRFFFFCHVNLNLIIIPANWQGYETVSWNHVPASLQFDELWAGCTMPRIASTKIHCFCFYSSISRYLYFFFFLTPSIFFYFHFHFP